MLRAMPFRFDAGPHVYRSLDTGRQIPNITSMLERTGWIDDTWFTEESSDRGSCVHQLTADYDLGALDPVRCVSPFRGYLLAHVKAMQALEHTWESIEEPAVHPAYPFGGRPDRIGRFVGLKTVLEIKSGAKTRAHQIQTALQAILVSWDGGLPGEHYQRLAEYLRPDGKFSLELHKDRRDFTEARRVLKVCCNV